MNGHKDCQMKIFDWNVFVHYVSHKYGNLVQDLWYKSSLTAKVKVFLWHRSEISCPSQNINPNWLKEKSQISQWCSFKHLFNVVSRSQMSSLAGNFTLETHSHVLADGAPVWVHAASASYVCVLCLPPKCAWYQPAGHVVYLTQNRTPLMFQRMEPPSEGGGTDGQGEQGLNGLPSTQSDNLNPMWVTRHVWEPISSALKRIKDMNTCHHTHTNCMLV